MDGILMGKDRFNKSYTSFNSELELKSDGNEITDANNLFDNDIKNELVELANKVTQAFANQIEFADSCLNDSSAFIQHFDADKKVEPKNKDLIAYESLFEAKQRLENTNTKKVELWQNEISNEQNIDENEIFFNQDEDNSSTGNESDFKIPEVDWENLEAKLKEAQQEISKQVF